MRPSPSPNLWALLDALPTQVGVAAAWRPACGHHFDALVRAGLLVLMGQSADEYPCAHPVPCPCFHRIDPGAGPRRARCTCDPADCPPFVVKPEDIPLYRLSMTKLADMVRHAFRLKGGAPRPVTGLTRTFDIGSWYPERAYSYKAFLCLADDEEHVSASAHAISAQATKPFAFLILNRALLVSAAEQSIAAVGGVVHALTDTTRLTPAIELEYTTCPADLFAPLHAHTARKHMTQPESEKVLKALKEMARPRRRGPTEWELAELYARDGKSLAEIARESRGKWKATTVKNVAKDIRERNIDLDELRASFHSDPEEDLANKGLGGRGIYRTGLVQNKDENDEQD